MLNGLHNLILRVSKKKLSSTAYSYCRCFNHPLTFSLFLWKRETLKKKINYKKNHFPSPHLKIFWKCYFFVFSTEVTGLIMDSVQILPPWIKQDRFFHEEILHGLLTNQYNSINAATVEACTRLCLGTCLITALSPVARGNTGAQSSEEK